MQKINSFLGQSTGRLLDLGQNLLEWGRHFGLARPVGQSAALIQVGPGDRAPPSVWPFITSRAPELDPVFGPIHDRLNTAVNRFPVNGRGLLGLDDVLACARAWISERLGLFLDQRIVPSRIENDRHIAVSVPDGLGRSDAGQTRVFCVGLITEIY